MSKNNNLDEKEYKTLNDFYPFYLNQHSNNLNRLLHYIGSLFSLFTILIGIFTNHVDYLLYAVVMGYGFAWIGHFFIEENRPATFKYPLMSLACDFIMLYHFLTLEISDKFIEYKIKNNRIINLDYI